MELIFVTSNEKKIKAAKNILEKENIKIKPINLEIKEIQGNPKEVAIQKAKDAFKIIKEPLIINDSSFHIEALNGFPSTYASYVEKTLGDEYILKLLQDETNRKAYYLDILVYIDKYGYQVFEAKTRGRISETSFKAKYPYDRIFIKENDEYPIGYYQDKIDTIYENETYQMLGDFFKKRKVARGITFINDQVLLLHRIRKEFDNYLDYYAIPGGGVEEETIEEACTRELKEETSLEVTLNTYLGFDIYSDGICYYFKTNYQGGTPVLGGEEKEKNNPDNFYEITLLPIEELDKINMYGIGKEMIKKAYDLKNKTESN